MRRVVVPTQLHSYTGGRSEVSAEGDTLAEVLADLERQFTGIRFRVIDEHDRVRQHIVIFAGSKRLDDLDAPLAAGTAVQIVGALSGG
jgi:molybdopterin converting factor small subunit